MLLRHRKNFQVNFVTCPLTSVQGACAGAGERDSCVYAVQIPCSNFNAE